MHEHVDGRTWVQARLKHLGFDYGRSDGTLGQGIAQALQLFRARYQLAMQEDGHAAGIDAANNNKVERFLWHLKAL